MKDFFKKANELQVLIYRRAMEFYEANDGRQVLYSRGVDFNGETVTVAYGVENEPYDCEHVTLSIEQLEMSSSKWYFYISQIKREAMEKKAKAEEEKLREEIWEKEQKIKHLEDDIERIKNSHNDKIKELINQKQI